MSIPNELVQGIVDIKTAIENKSADTPVDIPDREYPDELCEALGAVKDAIENSQGGGENYTETYTGTAAEILLETGIDLPALIRKGDVSVYFTFDLTALGFPASITLMVNEVVGNGLYCNNISYGDVVGLGGLYAQMIFNQNDKIYAEEILSISQGNVTDGTSYAGSIPTVMKINYHPMPEE